jgi:hypothetical protein
LNIELGLGAVARRTDTYFQVNADGNSLVFERSEPYPNPNQPLGASILASRQVERLCQTLRGVLDEDSRQLLTMQRQSSLGGRGLLGNYGDRVAFAHRRIATRTQRSASKEKCGIDASESKLVTFKSGAKLLYRPTITLEVS